jgi:membrane protein DedA with SNARE-associated domain
MKFDLKKIRQFLKKYQADIILFIGVILISLLSFALGYILAKHQEKEPLKFEMKKESHENSDYWGRNNWPLS